MKIYQCEKCGKEYTHKGNYMKHLQRKTPCNKNLNKKTEIINFIFPYFIKIIR